MESLLVGGSYSYSINGNVGNTILMYVDGIDIAHEKVFYYEYKLVVDRVFDLQDPLFRIKDVPELIINESKLKSFPCKSCK